MALTDLPTRRSGSRQFLPAGEKVRYDGAQARPFLVETLGRFVELSGLPRGGMRLPTPRERCASRRPRPSAPGHRKTVWITPENAALDPQKLQNLEGLTCAAILQERFAELRDGAVQVYGRYGIPARSERMFTKAFMDRFPLIPVEEEGRFRTRPYGNVRRSIVHPAPAARPDPPRETRGKPRGVPHRPQIPDPRAREDPVRRVGRAGAHAKELPLEELYGRYLRLSWRRCGSDDSRQMRRRAHDMMGTSGRSDDR